MNPGNDVARPSSAACTATRGPIRKQNSVALLPLDHPPVISTEGKSLDNFGGPAHVAKPISLLDEPATR
uniref:Uncharacterized protein n=1 Tax=Candidatus Kentrum sp. SD TaxID=2126332 RepID=A0A450YGQ9_9GAMM|nr:MAG: hypothetical protein BECKSD772F_GA0070984_106913 [Candidatus Kentron sp. SD]VFK46191.1 MAG: hypothetical protein BECKSD772E_GA0070983_106813 [Candidatus Kentron sp. SD]